MWQLLDLEIQQQQNILRIKTYRANEKKRVKSQKCDVSSDNARQTSKE